MLADELPRLLLIADGFTDRDVMDRVIRAVERGVPWIQLRDHEATTDQFEVAVGKLMGALTKKHLAPLVSINGHADIARLHGAGVHTGAHGPSVESLVSELDPDALVGASVHSRFEAEDARNDGAKYVIFSPIYETPSKPGHKGWGTDLLQRVAYASAPVPVVALGGITPERAVACFRAGAHAVAAQRAILEAPDIDEAVFKFTRVTDFN